MEKKLIWLVLQSAASDDEKWGFERITADITSTFKYRFFYPNFPNSTQRYVE